MSADRLSYPSLTLLPRSRSKIWELYPPVREFLGKGGEGGL